MYVGHYTEGITNCRPNVPCGTTASRVPWQRCQTITVLAVAVLANLTVPFLHAGNACASQQAPDNVNTSLTIRYDTIAEFNVDSKAEYTA